jgi:hypothetical protein
VPPDPFDGALLLGGVVGSCDGVSPDGDTVCVAVGVTPWVVVGVVVSVVVVVVVCVVVFVFVLVAVVVSVVVCVDVSVGVATGVWVGTSVRVGLPGVPVTSGVVVAGRVTVGIDTEGDGSTIDREAVGRLEPPAQAASASVTIEGPMQARTTFHPNERRIRPTTLIILPPFVRVARSTTVSSDGSAEVVETERLEHTRARVAGTDRERTSDRLGHHGEQDRRSLVARSGIRMDTDALGSCVMVGQDRHDAVHRRLNGRGE